MSFALRLPTEEQLDDMIRVDEAQRRYGNSLFRLSEGELRTLYRSVGCTAADDVTHHDRLTAHRAMRAAPPALPHLSRAAVDGLPDAVVEANLIAEYENERRRLRVREAVNSVAATAVGSDAWRQSCRAAADHQREEDAYRGELYRLAQTRRIGCGPVMSEAALASRVAATVKEEMTATTTRSEADATRADCGPSLTASRERVGAVEDISNSALPGPYLTLQGPGRYTRFEALCHRYPTFRSAQSIVSRRNDSEKKRSTHYPVPRPAAVAADHEHAVSHRPAACDPEQVLRHWKHRMGVTVDSSPPEPVSQEAVRE